GPRGQQGADPRPRVELRLRRRRPHRRVVRLLPASQDRQARSAADPHCARRRVRAPAATRFRRVTLRPWRQWTLRSRMVVVVAALAAVALIAANVAGALLLRSYLLDRIDSQLRVGTHAPRFGGVSDVQGRRPGIGPDVLFYTYDSNGLLTRSP